MTFKDINDNYIQSNKKKNLCLTLFKLNLWEGTYWEKDGSWREDGMKDHELVIVK